MQINQNTIKKYNYSAETSQDTMDKHKVDIITSATKNPLQIP
jgi:hypothetical protein